MYVESCDGCGALVAGGMWNVHRRFHKKVAGDVPKSDDYVEFVEA